MSTLWQDIRYGLRMLRKSPGFTAVAVVSLALGIGANTAVFSLLNAVMLRSLPVENPQQLRVLNWAGPELSNVRTSGMSRRLPDGRRTMDAFSYATYCDFRDQTQDKAEIFAYSRLLQLSVLTQHEATTALGLMVSGHFFSGLGARPLIGRTIGAEDDRPEAEPVAVISYRSWERHFGLSPEVLGQTVTLNKHNFAIVGVLPRGFQGPLAGYQSDFYAPMSAQPKLRASFPLDSPRHWWVQLMARVRPGVADEQIQAAFTVLLNQTVSTHGLSSTDEAFNVLLEDGSAGPLASRQYLARPLYILMGIVGIVLVAACANLAGLLLARGASRQREQSVRAALGAGHWRLARQSLTESLLIALLGAGLGLLLAIWGRSTLSKLLWPSGITVDVRSDLFVLGFTLMVSLAAALLFGLIPAWRSTRANPMASLKERSALGTTRLRTGRVLVTMQVALSMLLLVGAGLFARTLVNLRDIDAGFNTEHLLVFNLDAAKAGYEGRRRVGFYEQVRNSLAALPGVTAVTSSNNPLLGGYVNSRGGIAIPGSPSDEKISALELEVGPQFLSAMGIDLLAGRDFTAADNETSAEAIIVNNAFAEKVFPGQNPAGRLLTVGSADYQIVGVCGDIKYDDIKKPAEPTIFYPYLQRPDEVYSVYFEVRTAMPPLALVPAVRKALAEIDRNIPVADIRTQKMRIDESIAQERLFASLSGTLAMLAVLLSCIGLFGLMAYNIAQRTGEIGIRKALGAGPKDVAWPVLRETLVLAGAGVVLGLPAALALVRIIRGYLFGVSPYDPAALVGAAILLVTVALLAAWLPARRAARVDPMVALRCE